MEIKYTLLDTELLLPSYGHPGDAGFDVYAREAVTLLPGEWKAIPTGMCFELPEGYVALVWDKSGIAIKNGLKTLGGVIDAGYRGEYMIGMINLGTTESFTFEKGQKVAQILIQKVEHVTFAATESLSKSARGQNGFGSTGK